MKSEFIEGLKCQVYSIIQKNKKIGDILPSKEYGINVIDKENGNEIIDKIVEEPLKKACKNLRNKGIETVMSSANRNNLLKQGEKRLEKEDVKGKEYFLDAPTYESAGKGYAWIMLNYDSLSDENKEELFSIEKTQDSNGINIGEKIVWFIQGPSVMYNFNMLKTKEQKKNILDEKFKNSSFILQYNSDWYPKQVVILRMPINNKTTVTDVELYFEKLIERLKQQQVEINNPSMERE